MLVNSTIADLNAMLRSENMVIVHFSGQPRGHGAKAFFPDDLLYAIRNRTTCRLACSTVKPGDDFTSFQGRNATGSVGIMIAPLHCASLLDVWYKDRGSEHNRIVRDVTLSECQGTITGRVEYNEWAITDYEVLGLFVVDPRQVDGVTMLPDGFGGLAPSTEPTDVDLANLDPELARLPIFTFANGGLARIAAAIDHSALYP